MNFDREKNLVINDKEKWTEFLYMTLMSPQIKSICGEKIKHLLYLFIDKSTSYEDFKDKFTFKIELEILLRTFSNS